MKTWKSLDTFPASDPWAQFAQLLILSYPRHRQDEFFSPDSVILIDEAQASYSDYVFWNQIVKPRRSDEGKSIKLCLFCSYGSPETGLEVDRGCFTPVTFGPAQRVTLTPQPGETSPKLGLFFTLDEVAETVLLLTTQKYEEPLTIDTEAIGYIFQLTNGHPGAVTSLTNYIYAVCTCPASKQEANELVSN